MSSMNKNNSEQSNGQKLNEMRTYTQEEILAERAKIHNAWEKGAFYASTIIFTVLLYSASKIVDIDLIYKFLFRFGIYWLLPQLIGIIIVQYIRKLYKFYEKVFFVIIFFTQIIIVYTMNDILDEIGIMNALTIAVSWLYLIAQVLRYFDFIRILKGEKVKWIKL